MNRLSVFKSFSIILMLFVVAAGCTRYVVADRAVDFNRAVETSTNKLLLLNAVRASMRYPMHFSEVTSVTTTPRVTTGVDFSVPFGRGTMNPLNASPSIALEHRDAISMAPLNTHEFYRGVLEQVNLQTVLLFLSQGWPVDRFLGIAVEKATVGRDRAVLLIARALLQCPTEQRSKDCEELKSYVIALSDSNAAQNCRNNENYEGDHTLVACLFSSGIIDNDPDEPSEFLKFVAILRAGEILDLQYEPVGRQTDFSATQRKVITDENSNITKIEETQERASSNRVLLSTVIEPNQKLENMVLCSPPSDFNFQNQLDNRCYTGLESTAERQVSGEALGASLRSPEGMLFYLGELINAQRTQSENALDQAASQAARSMFPVDFGIALGAAVLVEFEGTIYSIPAGDEGRRSRQVLSLVNQLLNLQKNREDLPGVPTVISVGG